MYIISYIQDVDTVNRNGLNIHTVEPSVGPLTEKTVIDLCPKVDC